MITERRISPTGGWTQIEKLPPPEQMTDQELKKKVCGIGKATCEKCGMLDGCKYGKEFLKREYAKGAKQ